MVPRLQKNEVYVIFVASNLCYYFNNIIRGDNEYSIYIGFEYGAVWCCDDVEVYNKEFIASLQDKLFLAEVKRESLFDKQVTDSVKCFSMAALRCRRSKLISEIAFFTNQYKEIARGHEGLEVFDSRYRSHEFKCKPLLPDNIAELRSLLLIVQDKRLQIQYIDAAIIKKQSEADDASSSDDDSSSSSSDSDTSSSSTDDDSSSSE